MASATGQERREDEDRQPARQGAHHATTPEPRDVLGMGGPPELDTPTPTPTPAPAPSTTTALTTPPTTIPLEDRRGCAAFNGLARAAVSATGIAGVVRLVVVGGAVAGGGVVGGFVAGL